MSKYCTSKEEEDDAVRIIPDTNSVRYGVRAAMLRCCDLRCCDTAMLRRCHQELWTTRLGMMMTIRIYEHRSDILPSYGE